MRNLNLHSYSRPVFLSHYPLFRQDDRQCDTDDATRDEWKLEPLYPELDVFNKNVSARLLRLIKPRLIFNGHTHYGCLTLHPDPMNQENDFNEFQLSRGARSNYRTNDKHNGTFFRRKFNKIEEWTLVPFNWRFGPVPSFVMLTISPDKYIVSKCRLPNEFCLAFVYVMVISLILTAICLRYKKNLIRYWIKSKVLFSSKVLKKYRFL